MLFVFEIPTGLHAEAPSNMAHIGPSNPAIPRNVGGGRLLVLINMRSNLI